MSSSFRRGGTRPKTRRIRKESNPLLSSNSNPTPISRSTPTSGNTHSTVLELIGTKPWVGGVTLTSSGLRELDAILGGGQPLGTAMMIEEDRWTQDLALALVRYWAAEVSLE
jgi:hypothetical protein